LALHHVEQVAPGVCRVHQQAAFRVFQHKNKPYPDSFTAQYEFYVLDWCEPFGNVIRARIYSPFRRLVVQYLSRRIVMNKLFAAVCVVAFGVLLPKIAVSQDCNPACGQGQVCCVMQYSNGTYSSPYCKTGNSCYTSATKKPLKAKELDAAEAKDNSSSSKTDKKDAKKDKSDH
jgi:hypothetical protein